MIRPVTPGAVAGAGAMTPARPSTQPGGTFAGGVGNARQKFMASLPEQVQALRGGAGGWNDFRAALNPQQQADLMRIRTGEGRANATFDPQTGQIMRPQGGNPPPRPMGPPQGGPRPMAPGPGSATGSLMPGGQSSAPWRQPMPPNPYPPQNIQSGGSPAMGALSTPFGTPYNPGRQMPRQSYDYQSRAQDYGSMNPWWDVPRQNYGLMQNLGSMLNWY